MEWREANATRWLEAELPGATAVFSTRTSGSAKKNLEPLAAALGLESRQIATARQVHGAELLIDGENCDAVEADGHVLRQPGGTALVFVADCLPIALAGPSGAAILHCGWRGLAAGIVAKGVAAVGATHAAIGPGVGRCCYEVGDEVLATFATLGEGIFSGRKLDLPEVARRLLADAGVETVESAELCTSCRQDLFFSHRRDGGPGRQAGLIRLGGQA
jgi:polyphenol oxidase